MIHPSAIVSPKAEIGENVTIGAYAIVHDNVVIGDDSVIEEQVVLRNGARIGKSVTIDSFCVIAGLPQDLGFDPSTPSFARIGDGTTIREGSTVNRATTEGGETVVGEKCYIMAVSHVAHDCVLGKQVVLANNSMLAGFVSIGDHSFVGGGAGLHQFCRIGPGVMIGGNASISLDIPPYTLIADRNELHGLNVVGLRRRGHGREAILSLKECYRKLYGGKGRLSELAETLLEEYGESTECREFLEFFASDKRRGYVRPMEKG